MDDCREAHMEETRLTGPFGSVHFFELFGGLTVSFYDVKISRWEGEGLPETIFPRTGQFMEINHCAGGRFECEYDQGSFYYLGEGDWSVSRQSDRKKTSGFPLGIYRGISILAEPEGSEGEFSALLGQFGIALREVSEKWRKMLPCKIFPPSWESRAVFESLYRQEDCMTEGFLKCKIIELFFLLCRCDLSAAHEKRRFSRFQVEKVRRIRRRLEQDLDRELTLEELVREEDTSQSSLKRCFCAIYGKTPARYRMEYRMQAAAKLLLETENSIADIGLQVGYLNPSKFSQAFRLMMGETPSQYRSGRENALRGNTSNL